MHAHATVCACMHEIWVAGNGRGEGKGRSLRDPKEERKSPRVLPVKHGARVKRTCERTGKSGAIGRFCTSRKAQLPRLIDACQAPSVLSFDTPRRTLMTRHFFLRATVLTDETRRKVRAN